MKILFISNLFPPHVLGGYEILCGQVAQALQDRGHEVSILTSRHGVQEAGATRDLRTTRPEGALAAGEPPASEEASSPGITVLRELELYVPFGEPAGLLRGQRWSVGRKNRTVTEGLIRAQEPDLIFIWSQLRLTVGPARAAEASGIPVAYTFNDGHPAGFLPTAPSFSPRRLAGFLSEKALFRDITIRGMRMGPSTAISGALRSELEEKGVPVEECRVIHQGIPLVDFPVKARPGHMHGPPRIMYAGQLHRYKGVHTLIQAAHLLSSLGVKLEVEIYGEGPADYKAELREAAEAGPAAVRFHGRVGREALARAYRDNDVLVFPSTWEEPFGLTHLEAMASGTPVVSTLTGGVKEFLRDGENCLTFPAEDSTALMERLWELIWNPSLRKRLALEGRATVESRFALERYVTDLEAFLREVGAQALPSAPTTPDLRVLPGTTLNSLEAA